MRERSRALRSVVCALALLHAVGPRINEPLMAQETAPGDAGGRRLLSDAARVSLVTILPGKKVYSIFGHNAIRVVDPERGIDVAYNYGTFDFGSPLAFTAKFVYGDLNYRLARQRYDRMVAYYPSEEGRPLIEQWLDLDAHQRESIFRFLEWNALPENAYYHYDFYYDNCATRVRDLLEDALGADLRAELRDPDRTMRQLLDPYLVEKPLLHLGMDFAQGVPADRPATARDAMFLPDHLAAWVAEARLAGPGGERALVARTDSIGWAPERAILRPAPPWPGLVFGALFVWIVFLTVIDVRSGRRQRGWLDLPLFGFLGMAGLFVVFTWFVSLHAVAKRNINILWVLPTHIGLAWALARKHEGRWIEIYLWATVALAAIFVLGWPLWTQEIPAPLVLLSLSVGVRAAGLAIVRRRADPSASRAA